MEEFVIEGECRSRESPAGSKTALPLLAACMLIGRSCCTVHQIRDV
jgi:hypothetical protein